LVDLVTNHSLIYSYFSSWPENRKAVCVKIKSKYIIFRMNERK